MKTMTIRNVSTELSDALREEKRRRGLSLNRTVLEVLGQALGAGGSKSGSNGLAQIAGTWSKEDLARFEEAVADFEQVDPELWK